MRTISSEKTKAKTFKTLFRDEVGLLLSTEAQILASLPTVRSAVFTEELADILNEQAGKAKISVGHLKSLLAALEPKKAKASENTVVKSLIVECSNTVKRYEDGNLRDSALLVCLQRLEHHRIAMYTSTLALAKQLGEEEIFGFLKEAATIDDLAAKRFAQVALQVNAEAFIDTHSERCAPVIS
jgi:ferritin-like metal-binding protein YciE